MITVYMSSPPKLLSRNWAWRRGERHELKAGRGCAGAVTNLLRGTCVYGTTLALEQGVTAVHSPVSHCWPAALHPLRAPMVPAQPERTRLLLRPPGRSAYALVTASLLSRTTGHTVALQAFTTVSLRAPWAPAVQLASALPSWQQPSEEGHRWARHSLCHMVPVPAKLLPQAPGVRHAICSCREGCRPPRRLP